VQNWIRNIGVEPSSQQKGEQRVSKVVSDLRMMDQECVELNISILHTKASWQIQRRETPNVET
jgi:hypothetical protein